jgi:alkanesulfonate monooxygenase SsuD/methylene tetrahydromethanopterin reductase-like flavin-dependent oxidoreductase (luciferase family)
VDVGIQMLFSTYGWPGMKDSDAWWEEIRLARLADELGFDVIWSVEHHFFDYSFCPDNLQVLAYLAPLCTHADLGTAAIILPWNDPLRVAEKISVLDLLSDGRLRLGLGRGLAAGVRRVPRHDGRLARTLRRSRDHDPRGASHRLH